jgi:hypothetical protein
MKNRKKNEKGIQWGKEIMTKGQKERKKYFYYTFRKHSLSSVNKQIVVSII